MKTTRSLRNMLFTGLAITGLVLSSISFTSCEEDDDGDKKKEKETEEQGFQLLSAYVEGEQGSLPSDYQTQLENHFNDNGNVHDTTGMVSLSYDDILNTIIPASGEAGNGEALSGDNFIEEVSYQGAFEPGGSNWASWTLSYGMEDYKNGSYTYGAQDTMKVSGNITSSTTWSNTTLYKLDGFVFVTNGAKLTIEAGTMIQGLPGQGENASALIIANDGEIMAQGTADKPIVFTGDDDTYTGDNYGTKVSGLWGGLIVLGNAPTNNPGNYRVEGIPESDDYPSTYGGDVSDDNSGILEYVSIRHGGTNIGQGNEINGLTLAGVGTETTIDNIEVIANVDDGVEWFGGTANTSHLFVAYCGDDSFDYDEGFQGKGQFWATVQAEGTGNRLGEHDSGGDGEGTKPYSKPQIYNATYVGNGSETLITFRDDAGGTYANSIFYNVSEGIEIEYRDDKHCSWDQFATEGNLVIKNNIFKGIAE